MLFRITFSATLGVGLLAGGITVQEVIDAQMAWGEGIVAIAKTRIDGGDFTGRATTHINALYAYGETPVMFKPTLAAADQFRETFDEALS